MKKYNVGFIVFFLLLILGLIYYYTYPLKGKYVITGGLGYVTKKEADDYNKKYIYVKMLSHNNESKENKIIVKDVNVWNLIEINRAYTIIFRSYNGSIPLLEKIEIIKDFHRTDCSKFNDAFLLISEARL